MAPGVARGFGSTSGSGTIIGGFGGRDGDPRACYAVLEDHQVTWHRIAYDYRITQKKILDTGGRVGGPVPTIDGGFLVIDALKLLRQPFSWEELKRALASRLARIESPVDALGLGTTTRVLASAQIMRQDNLPDYGIPGSAWAEAPLAPTTVMASVTFDITSRTVVRIS